MLMHNAAAQRGAYPQDLRAILDLAQMARSRAALAHWPQLAPGPTPLHALPDAAARLGVGALYLKDESVRSPLGSFKALGAPIALVRWILREHACTGMDAAGLFAGRWREAMRGLTVISATDGNHGRALAAAARSVGCRCVIVLHAGVGAEREQAIAAWGAQIVRVDGDYDASVIEAARLAQAHGWQVVSDTSYAGYETIPRDVMQGYAIIAAEAWAQHATLAPQAGGLTHVFVQGGVGGLAAGVVSALWEHHGAQRPRCIVVEPRQADSLYKSARLQRAARASGSVDTLMAGLACGETSPLAWRFLHAGADAFLLIDDDMALEAMRSLARGGARDRPVVAGESGAAGLAGLVAACAEPDHAAALALDRQAQVLVINTEGATAPALYQRLVGLSAAQVLAR